MFWLNEANAASSFMPPQATDIAVMYDSLYSFLVVASFIASFLVMGGFIYFVLKYKRRSDSDKTAYIPHDARLEFLWSFIPFLIFMFTFGWGWHVYKKMRTAPKDSLEIHVTGQKWSWSFQYKSGRKTSAEMYVPINQPVKLIMGSRDVVHSFFIPAFRVKQDVVPGMYTSLWFEATKLGTFQVFCAEYCGEQHSGMLAKIHVLSQKDYEKWLQNDPYKGLSLIDIGKKVYASKCFACHNTSAEKNIGPGFAGVLGRQREFEGGGSLIVDDNYIRESIINPNAKVVKGFPKGVMPTFAGQVSEQELAGIVEYLKSLK